MRPYETLKTTDVLVKQRPYAVEIQCPYCEDAIEMTYEDMTDLHGAPPDWDYTKIECPYCGMTFMIDGQDWD